VRSRMARGLLPPAGMLRRTYSILAVAITTSAACGGVTTESTGTPGTSSTPSTLQALADELARTPLADALARRDHFRPLCDSGGYPLPGNVNGKGAPLTTVAEFCNAIGKPLPAPPPTPDPKPAPTPACDTNALNVELSNTLLDDAVRQHAHFRCLCDDKGYPLVGNINAKGATASQFCTALRDKGLL
jgi:hypothetical protein